MLEEMKNNNRIKNYDIIEIDKLNKPKEFIELYKNYANPLLHNARAKVPVLEILTIYNDDNNNDIRNIGANSSDNNNNNNQNKIVLCESTVIAEYLAEEYFTLPFLSTNPTNTRTATTSDKQPQQKQIPIQEEENMNLMLPVNLEKKAIMKLFIELCGSNFTYLPLLRAKDIHQFKVHLEQFQQGLQNMNVFLGHIYEKENDSVCNNNESKPYFLFGNSQFTLAECTISPFLQRCCYILPTQEEIINTKLTTATTMVDELSSLSIHPMDICEKYELRHLQNYINSILSHPSVRNTSPTEVEMSSSHTKLLKRLIRLQQQNEEKQKTTSPTTPANNNK